MNALTQPSSDENRPKSKGWKTWLKVMLAAAVGIALLLTTRNAWDRLKVQDAALEREIESLHQDLPEISEAERKERHTLAAKLERSRLRLETIRWPRVLLGTAVYALGLLASAVYWWRILLAFGYHPRPANAIAAHVVGHLGKYVPGKAFVVIMRAAGVAQEGIPFSVAAVAAVMETLSYMAIGAMFAGLATLLIETPFWIRALAVALTVLTLVPTLPPIFRPLMGRIWRNRSSTITLDHHQYSWSLAFSGWGLLAIAWLATGFAFWCVIRALPAAADTPWEWRDGVLATGAIGLAVVAGFASLLPGGAGVRELVLVTLLAPRFGLPSALAAAVVARLAFMFAEVVAFGACRFWLGRRPVE